MKLNLNKQQKNKLILAVALTVISCLGVTLRLINQYAHLIYPDAYQNLLVARNLKIYQGVLGYLGEGGMLYPPFFGWSRIGYALLINLFQLFGMYELDAARIAALSAGVAAIPITYLYIKELWGSVTAGLTGALLLAVSFNHVVWGGFVLTESSGVLLLLIFLWLLFKSLNQGGSVVIDNIAGGVLSLAVLTRYEYVFIWAGIVLLLLSEKAVKQLLRIVFGFVITFSVLFVTYYPVKSTIEIIYTEENVTGKIGLVLMLLTMIIIISGNLIEKITGLHIKDGLIKWTKRICLGGIIFVFIYLAADFISGGRLREINMSGIRDFVTTDMVLTLIFLYGIFQLVREPDKDRRLLFNLINILGLGFIYMRSNPGMLRYLTHILPFILAIGSYFSVKLIELRKHRTIITVLITALGIQLLITGYGMKKWEGGAWTQESYEQTAAKTVARNLSNNVVLIASFPEPYYFYSGNTTLSQTNLISPDSIMGFPDDRPVAIISDMGTREMFPTFFAFLKSDMEKFKSDEFYTNKDFYMGGRKIKEEGPVEIYITNIAILRQKLSR